MDVRDGTHDSPKYIATGYPLVTSKNLVNGQIDFSTCSFISKEDFDAISKRSAVDDGDILYAMIGTIGNPVIVRKQSEFAIKNVALFKFNNQNVSNRYVYHFLNSELTVKQFNSNSRGGTQKFVSLTNIRDLKIPLPPLAEQQKIVAILDAADSLRQKDQQLVERYTALSQSLFLEMFGDLELMANKPLKQVSKFIDYRGKTPIKTASGVPLLTARNIKVGYISNEPREFISMPGYVEWMTRGFPKEGDILFTTEAPLGNAALLPKFEKVAIAQRLICIQPTYELNSYFLMYVLFSEYFKNQLFNRATGSTVKGVRSKELEKIQVPLPPIELQNQFAERIQLIEAQKQQAQLSLEKSEALFNSLLQRAFTGELTAKMAA
jgi:type I restriction enzyme, S subunit